MKKNSSSLTTFCTDLVVEIGNSVLSLQHDIKKFIKKDNVDIQLSQDIVAEEMYIKKIASTFPSHGIFSEEIGSINAESEYQWIIDPIDGSKEYFRGLDDWNTNLTLQFDHKPILSAIYLPIPKQLYYANEHGAFLNNNLLQIPQSKLLKDSVIHTYLPNYTTPRNISKKVWSALELLSYDCYRIRGSVRETVDIAKVASGQHDAQMSLGQFPKWYDFVAGFFIATSAGVKVTNLEGESVTPENSKHGYIAAPQKLHQTLLKKINKYLEAV